jgi:hypothetical protein
MKRKVVKYVPQSAESFILERMKREKGDGYIKKGTFTNEIVWGKYAFIVPRMTKKKQLAFKRGMFLFGMVRADAKRFLNKEADITLPKKHPQILYANNISEDRLENVTGTDLNHAYWRIAYNLGVISQKTYEKGLNDDFKSVRLAALSTLGSPKKYQRIKEGEIVRDFYTEPGDESLQKVYTLIRYTCYRYMTQVKRLLKNDFVAYKTDAIYYVDNKENRKLVKCFFTEKGLTMKQLV